MRILYLIDRGIMGGLQRHTQCLAECLKDEHEVVVCVYGCGGPVVDSMRAAGLDVRVLGGKSGHDLVALPKFARLLKTFRPDVIHAHMLGFLPLVYLALFARKIPLVLSHHTAPGPEGLATRLFRWRIDYHLAVSQATLELLKKYNPQVRGEVFYNPVRVARTERVEKVRAVGMVGRGAKVKDWPSFHRVEALVRDIDPGVEFWNLGEKENCPNGREMIGKMNLMLMTSFSEQMPTVVLEAFAERTPVCGFIPQGGMAEILTYSSGPLREVFIADRDCEKLAGIVRRILADEKLRQDLIEDGWRIVTEYFDAERLCRGRLAGIYRNVMNRSVEEV